MTGRVRPDPTRLLPLTTQAFHILLALADGERHGYAIMREVEEGSAGQVRLGPGTLYGAIKRLLEQGVIEELQNRPVTADDDARRRYYRLTAFGKRVLAAEADRLAELVRAVRAKKLTPRTKLS
jgi:DNA-binding PadR family transcriptional regulator